MKNFMLKTKEELKKFLDDGKNTEEEIDIFMRFIEPFYNFYDFMLEEHGKSFEEVDKEMKDFSIEIFTDYLNVIKNEKDISKQLLEFSGVVMIKYAKKYNYKEPEKVGLALTKYTEISFGQHIKNKNKGNE